MAREVILQPGELFFGKEDVVVRTVLGSCIAITLWHPEQKQGGMCHYMLPSRRNPSAKLDGRYAGGPRLVAASGQSLSRPYP